MLSILHWLPSAAAAVLAFIIIFVDKGNTRGYHRYLGFGMAFFALLGLLGYIDQGGFEVLLRPGFHALHAFIGIAAFLLSLYLFTQLAILKRKHSPTHCSLGYIAGILAIVSLAIGAAILLGYQPEPKAPEPGTGLTGQVPSSSLLPEAEAAEFQGIALTPLSQQGNNAIEGTQQIDRNSYRLEVVGLVEQPGNFTYGELRSLPAYSEAAYMPCVEGWGFTAKWTGFRVADLLDRVRLKPGAEYVLFISADGYSTGLPIDYIQERQILMAYGINDVTLPPERGFPFQVVAKSKYGYKWGKWVTRIEVGDSDAEGYWESRGYSNSANVGEFPYG